MIKPFVDLKYIFYRFGEMFSHSQNDTLTEVGRNFWTIPFKSSTQAGSWTADCPGACTDSFECM